MGGVRSRLQPENTHNQTVMDHVVREGAEHVLHQVKNNIFTHTHDAVASYNSKMTLMITLMVIFIVATMVMCGIIGLLVWRDPNILRPSRWERNTRGRDPEDPIQAPDLINMSIHNDLIGADDD